MILWTEAQTRTKLNKREPMKSREQTIIETNKQNKLQQQNLTTIVEMFIDGKMRVFFVVVKFEHQLHRNVFIVYW